MLGIPRDVLRTYLLLERTVNLIQYESNNLSSSVDAAEVRTKIRLLVKEFNSLVEELNYKCIENL